MEDNNVSLEISPNNKTEDTSNDSEIKKKKEQPLRGVKRRKKRKRKQKKKTKTTKLDNNNLHKIKRKRKRRRKKKIKKTAEKPKKKRNIYYTYKKVGNKNTPYYKSKLLAKRVALALFENYTTRFSDLSYICKDEISIKRHIAFIKRCKPRKTSLRFNDVVIKITTFDNFKYYRNIHDRLHFLINICYNKEHRLYPYFGGKGITLSDEFLDAKLFCIWCIKNKLVDPVELYRFYIQRRDKTKCYSSSNCFVVSEKDIHENKYLDITLTKLLLQKKYDEGHAEKVNYAIAYSRYFQYDMEMEDALYMSRKYKASLCDFLPINFYKSVADENSCTLTVYLSRYKTLHDGGVPIDPYSFLDKDASVVAIARRYGVNTEKLERHKANNENREKRTNDIYKFFEDKAKELYNFDLNSPENSVYSNHSDNDVYSH